MVKFYGLELGVKVSYYCEIVENFVDVYLVEYDVVICMEMLEYVFDFVLVVKVCVIIVKSGGYVFFFIFNRNIKFYLMGIFGVEYLLKFVFKGIYDYGCFIKLLEFIVMIDEVNFFFCDMIGLYMDLFF